MASQRTFFRPHREQSGTARSELGKYAAETLGSGKLENAFKLPEGVSENDWLAVNIVDIYNNVSQLYGTLTEFCLPNNESCRTMNAGPKYEYLWADNRVRKPIHCSAVEYANYLFDWIDDQFTDTTVFPTEPADPYPPQFKKIIKTMCKKLFRIYAHMYKRHHEHLKLLEIYRHMNSAFKAFLYFCEAFDLIDVREVTPLRDHIQSNLKRGYRQIPRSRPKIEYAQTANANAKSYTDPGTPQSVIVNLDNEEEPSISISESPSSKLEPIDDGVEQEYLAHALHATSIDSFTTDGGSSPAPSVVYHNGHSSRSDRPPVLRQNSMTSTTSGASVGSSHSSHDMPNTDEIKTRFDRLKKKFLNHQEPKEESARSAAKRSHSPEGFSNSSRSPYSTPQASPTPETPSVPAQLLPLDAIEQEPQEEPRRHSHNSPRHRIAEQQRKHFEDTIEDNDSLRSTNATLQDRLSTALAEMEELRQKLLQANEEIERYRVRVNELEFEQQRERDERELERDQESRRIKELEKRFETKGNTLHVKVDTPESPAVVSVITPSPKSATPPPRMNPTTISPHRVVQRTNKHISSHLKQPNERLRASSDADIPPPPPPPPTSNRQGKSRSRSPRRMRGHPKTPQPRRKTMPATQAKRNGKVKKPENGNEMAESGATAEEMHSQLRSLADYSQSARVNGAPSRLHPHGIGGTPRISRTRASSNPRQAPQFIIRRKNADKPAPKRPLPKMPLPS